MTYRVRECTKGVFFLRFKSRCIKYYIYLFILLQVLLYYKCSSIIATITAATATKTTTAMTIT